MKQHYLLHTNWYALILCLWIPTKLPFIVGNSSVLIYNTLINPSAIFYCSLIVLSILIIGNIPNTIYSLIINKLYYKVLPVNFFEKNSKNKFVSTIC